MAKRKLFLKVMLYTSHFNLPLYCVINEIERGLKNLRQWQSIHVYMSRYFSMLHSILFPEATHSDIVKNSFPNPVTMN